MIRVLGRAGHKRYPVFRKEDKHMMTLILATMLTTAPRPVTTAQFQPCVWPNRCASVAEVQFKPCVWPNICAANVN